MHRPNYIYLDDTIDRAVSLGRDIRLFCKLDPCGHSAIKPASWIADLATERGWKRDLSSLDTHFRCSKCGTGTIGLQVMQTAMGEPGVIGRRGDMVAVSAFRPPSR